MLSNLPTFINKNYIKKLKIILNVLNLSGTNFIKYQKIKFGRRYTLVRTSKNL